MKKSVLIGLLIGTMLVPVTMVSEAQTVVFDKQIEWKWETSNNIYGGYGFYWWHRNGDGVTNLDWGDMPTDDWTSPNNYYNGEFTMRIEVIDQPSSQPFYVQMGIWQDKSKGTAHPETVSGRKEVSGGNGSVYEGSLGSPSTWWNKESGDKVDFSRPDDFYRIGVVLWNKSPLCIPMGTDWNPDGCPEFADDFFPMTVRVTVLAYASDDPPPPPPPPPADEINYTIDYDLERTAEEVSNKHQYSFDGGSTWTYASNDYLPLTPGVDVKFREGANWSNNQDLEVPARPATPSFTIDEANQRTAETVSSDFEYSTSSDMSGAVSGTGDHVSLTPGTTTYFRKKHTSSSFRSEIQALLLAGVPAPSYTINYGTEATDEPVSSDHEYSTDNWTTKTTGADVPVDLTPGLNVKFRLIAEPSAEQTLVVPDRPSAPGFTADTAQGRTGEIVSAEYEYSTESDMSGAITGEGDYVSLTPGTTMYFRKKHTASAFHSWTQTLEVPGIPPGLEEPAYTINFGLERTNENISVEHEYSFDEWSTFSPGAGEPLTLAPGEDVKFRVIAAPSLEQTLVVPDRPAAPSYTIDYRNEATAEAVSSDVLIGLQPDMSDGVTGSDIPEELSPGETLYFRKMATASAFASDISSLTAPGRPEAPGFVIDFDSEQTATPVGSGYIYSATADMLNPVTGNGTRVPVEPSSELHIRMLATDTSYHSEIQSIILPPRPPKPDIQVDFEAGTTSGVVTSGMVYSTSADFLPSIAGTGEKVSLTPGTDLYFRFLATMETFASEPATLKVPMRPTLTTEETDTTTMNPFTVTVIYFHPATDLSSEGITVTGGVVDKVALISTTETSTVYHATIIPDAQGEVTVELVPNSVNEGAFGSLPMTIYYKGVSTSVAEDGTDRHIRLYPNPADRQLHVESSLLEKTGTVAGIYTLTGELARQVLSEGERKIVLNTANLESGIYFLRITGHGETLTRKVIVRR